MNLEKDKVYVEHILECIDKINQYTDGNKQRFISNVLKSEPSPQIVGVASPIENLATVIDYLR